MAVSTGPAQGTKTGAEAQAEKEAAAFGGVAGRTKSGERPLDPLADPGGSSSPSEIAPSMATPNQKRKSWGRWRKPSNVVAKSTVKLKLRTSPPMMRKGRARFVLELPPAMTTGITGTMHGESPVIDPARDRDDDEFSHGRRIPPVAWSLAFLRSVLGTT